MLSKEHEKYLYLINKFNSYISPTYLYSEIFYKTLKNIW